MRKVRDFLVVETTNAATGVLPTAGDVHSQIYRARLEKGDSRLAEALTHTAQGIDPLEESRVHLMRGQLNKADRLLRPSGDCERDVEIALERARLANCNGDWGLAIEEASRALSAHPAAITRLTLHQVRSLAYFELGDLGSAGKDLDSAKTLTKLFPNSVIAVYVEATRIKVLSHGGYSDEARKAMDRLWAQLKKHAVLNIDTVLTLVRIEADWSRLNGQFAKLLSLANLLMARATGEEVYEHLCAIELYYSLSVAARAAWQPALQAAHNFNPRMRNLIRDIASGGCSSARSIANGPVTDMGIAPSVLEQYEQILFLRQKVTVDLRTLFASSLTLPAQLVKALSCLANAGCSREEFFNAIWGIRFKPEIHDEALRRLIYRIRRETPVEFEESGSRIALAPNILVVP